MEKTTLKFSRNRYIEDSREIAILSLDLRTHSIGEPALASYYTDSGHTNIDTILAIGVKNGTGRDSYRIVTMGQYDLLWEVVDSLPDVASLVHNEKYAYGDPDGNWFYVHEEGGQRIIEPFDATPRIFLCVNDNLIYVSGEDRKLRCITDTLSRTEIENDLRDMRRFVNNSVKDIRENADLALTNSENALEQVNTMREILEDLEGGDLVEIYSRVGDLEDWKGDVNPVLLDLDNKINPVVATMTGGIVGEYTGEDVSTTLRWEFTKDDQAIVPETISLKSGIDVLCDDPEITSLSVTSNKKGTTEFKLTGTYVDSLQTKQAAEVKQSITLYLPKYVGHSNKEGTVEDPLLPEDVLGFQKQNITGNTSGEYSQIQTDNDYIWLCFPAEFRPVVKMTSGGFDFSYVQPVIVGIEVAGENFDYRCYRSTNKLTGTWKITVTQ